MSTTDTVPMTVADFLALPEDGKERWLIHGQLREKDETMTYRNRFPSWAVGRITQLLWNWVDAQPQPHGAVYSGEAGCILRHDPDTVVGIDVVYFTREVCQRQTDETTLVDGVPLLAGAPMNVLSSSRGDSSTLGVEASNDQQGER